MKNLQFWENFQIYIQKSQCKTDFYPFSHSSSRTFVILFFLGWVAWADVVPPELGGGGGLYKHPDHPHHGFRQV